MREENGIIVKGLGGLYTVLLDGGESVECKARGLFRHENITPAIGDRVKVSFEDSSSDGAESITEIFDRKNILIRPPIANLDIIFAVIAAKKPQPSLLTADKLITSAEALLVEPVVIVSKADLDREGAEHIADIYRRSGFDVFITDKDGGGTAELLSYIKEKASGKICAFAGASGVGKSTLMNSLFPKLELATGDVSLKTERGRHTTRHVQLYPFSQLFEDKDSTGYLADTPGFAMLDFVRFDFYSKEELPLTFREFVPLLTKCRYTKCTHLKEEGCAVLEAVRCGDIPRERHDSFLEIYKEIKDKHDWDKK